MMSLTFGLFTQVSHSGTQCPIVLLLVQPTCGVRDIAVTISVRCMCVHACLRPSGFVRAITSTFIHEFQNNLAQCSP